MAWKGGEEQPSGNNKISKHVLPAYFGDDFLICIPLLLCKVY